MRGGGAGAAALVKSADYHPDYLQFVWAKIKLPN